MLVVFIERQEDNNLSDVNSVSKSCLEILNSDFATLIIFIAMTILLNTTWYREFELCNFLKIQFSDIMYRMENIFKIHFSGKKVGTN